MLDRRVKGKLTVEEDDNKLRSRPARINIKYYCEFHYHVDAVLAAPNRVLAVYVGL